MLGLAIAQPRSRGRLPLRPADRDAGHDRRGAARGLRRADGQDGRRVVDVYGPNAQGAGNVKRGTVTVETWTYDRGSQAFAMVVTIEDGKIGKMERAN